MGMKIAGKDRDPWRRLSQRLRSRLGPWKSPYYFWAGNSAREMIAKT